MRWLSAGRARHGAPGLARHGAPSSPRRWGKGLSLLFLLVTLARAALPPNSARNESDARPWHRLRRPLGIIQKHNPVREEARASIEAVERAAAVAVCQASKGYDCWQFATAPRAGQITHIKVLGERQSGARFVRTLVGLNLDVELVSLDAATRGLHSADVDALYAQEFPSTFGWRHACAPTHEQLEAVDPARLKVTAFVVVAKNPYAWLLSLYSKLSRYRGSERGSGAGRSTFEDFTRLPWPALGRENVASCQLRLEGKAKRDRGDSGFLNPVVMWNQKHRAYKRLRAPYVFFVRYEDVLVDPSTFLASLVTKLGLRRKVPFLVNVLQPTTGSGLRQSANAPNKTFDTYRKYYLHGGWQRAFRERALDRLGFIHRCFPLPERAESTFQQACVG